MNEHNNEVVKMCECIRMCRILSDELLYSEHHPDCPHRNIEQEAKGHIENLLDALEYEADMGDGINDEYYERYEAAKFFIKRVKGMK